MTKEALTDEEVRESYASGVNFEMRTPFPTGRKDFDAWFRKVKADAYDEGFDQGHYVNDSEDRDCGCRENPYRD